MDSRIRVAAASLNQTPLAWEDNSDNIKAAISAARRASAQILCLPELCISGYGCEDAFLSEHVVATSLTIAQELARETRGLVVSFGLPILVNGVVYNGVALAVDGSLRGFVAKQNLAGDGLHYEPRWFKPWPQGVVTELSLGGHQRLPCGDLTFNIGGVRIGFEICEDAWVADRPGFFLAQRGVDLILNPSASHFAFGKYEIRKRIILEGSRACGAGYIYANLLGCEAGRVIYDGDTFIASHGEMISQGRRFSFNNFEISTGVIDLARSRLIRRQRVGYKPRIADSEVNQVEVAGFQFSEAKIVGVTAPIQAWEGGGDVKHEEFSRAVSLGLFDYLRKSRSHGFVVSLSGGVDSSAVSCLVALMVRSALAELGLKGFLKRLDYAPWTGLIKGSKKDAELKILSEIIACVYQATNNSSGATRKAATSLAQEIGATFFDLDIEPLVNGYTSLIKEATGVKLNWSEHDVALQNIQARVRSPSVWLIANLRRALLLTTSNRSEAAVGYTTMDGDSSGGLAPIGGIDKAYLREWLRWIEAKGPIGLQRFSSLKLVNSQEPTAELRPLEAKQTDEGDLMPYLVLESIERRAVRDKLMPLEIWGIVCEEYRGVYSAAQLAYWIEAFFKLWSANQWKRERYAPSFHVDDESVDPKTWCRFPILSGGFKRELAELKRKGRKGGAGKRRG